MSVRSRVLTVLLLIIGVPSLFAFRGCIDLTRWAVSSGYSVGSMQADPASYGPNPAPSGDWLIVINSHSSVEQPLVNYLKRELPRITRDASSVATAKAVPPTVGERNVVWIRLTPRAVWTPFYGYITDRAEVIVTIGSIAPGPLPENTGRHITPGSIAVDIDYESHGQGIGLVGRAQMNAYRAKLIGQLTVKSILDAYRNAVPK